MAMLPVDGGDVRAGICVVHHAKSTWPSRRAACLARLDLGQPSAFRHPLVTPGLVAEGWLGAPEDEIAARSDSSLRPERGLAGVRLVVVAPILDWPGRNRVRWLSRRASCGRIVEPHST
jgi:hypothetical protein